MTDNLRIASVDEYRKALTQKDAILEKDIYDGALLNYLNLGGSPMDAVNMLSDSYIGIPSMTNATAKSVDSIGLNSNTILQKALRRLVVDRFNTERCDDIFQNVEMAPEWLDVLIGDPHWRHCFYELLERYPNSQFLNFAILRIVEAGHDEEIAKLRTASTYVKVYNLILQDALMDLVTKDDLEFDHEVPNLIRVCCEREDTYMYAQILIKRLYDEYGATPFNRLRRELEVAARRKGNGAFVDLLHAYVSGAPVELSRTIKSIMNSTSITPGDLATLKRFYSSESPPPTHFLCDYDLIVKMLKALYVPHHGSLLRAELVDDVTFLIAYATCMNDTKASEEREEQQSNVSKIQNVLRELYTALASKTEVGSITGAMKYILSAIRYPVGSMGVLLWIEYMAINTAYFETYFRTKETPILLLILDEIAERHKLQQPMVFHVIKKCIKHRTTIFAPEIQLKLQENWVDRMLFLVQLSYTLPVLKYFRHEGRELDDSLTIHFIKKLLIMAKAPYSVEFIKHMVAIIEPDVETLTLVKDVQQLVIRFLGEAQNSSSAPLGDHLEKSINKMMRTLSNH